MNSTRKLLGITVVLLTIIGLSGAGMAETKTTFFQPGANETVIGGDYEIVLVNDTRSGTWSSGTEFSLQRNSKNYFSNAQNDTVSSENGGNHFFNASAATTNWEGDGLYYLNATIWSGSGTRLDYNTTWVIVDNTAPDFDIAKPAANANFTNSSEILEITNLSDTNGYGNPDYSLSNGSMNLSSAGTEGWADFGGSGTTRTATVDSGSFDDGNYTIWYNLTDDAGNTAYASRDVYIDSDGPEINITSRSNGFEATVEDSPWPAQDTINFSVTLSGMTYNGSGSQNENTTVNVQDDSSVAYNISASDFSSAGNYTLTIWAEDLLGTITKKSSYTYIDGTDPTISSININDTSDRSNVPNSITTNGVFNLTVSHSDDETGIEGCVATVYDEPEWPDGSAIKSVDLNKGTSQSSGPVSLNGTEGNLTFDVECGDYGGNEVNDTTLTMNDVGSTQTDWFPMDNTGPTVSGFIPANESYVTSTTTTIEATFEDYTRVDNSSIQLWFNGSGVETSNITLNGQDSSNTTIDMSFDTPELNESTEYRMTLNASDAHGFSTGNISHNFTVDTTDPTIEWVNRTTNPDADEADEGAPGVWFADDVDYDVGCTDTTSGVSNYSLQDVDDGDDVGSGEDSNTNNLRYSINDDEFEENVTLEFSCTDNAGLQTTETRYVNIDTAPPEIIERVPGPDSSKGKDSLPYDDQTVRLEVEDNGAGFEGSWYSNYDPTFDDVGIDAADDDIGVEAPDSDDKRDSHGYIEWTQDDIDEGTHDISMGDSFEVMDAAGNTLEISEWSYDVSLTTDEQDNGGTGGTTSSGANLDITNAPSSISMVPGRTRTIDLNIENNGDSSVDADISVDSDDSDLDATVDPESIDIDADDIRAIDIDLDASDAFSGTADVTLEVEYGSNTETNTIEVQANPGSPDLTITEAPGEIDVWNNGTATSVSVSIENTGLQRANNLEPTVTGFTTSEDTFDFPPGETTGITVDVSNSNRDVGIYTETLRLSNDDQTVSQEIDVKVQPSDSETRQNITITLSGLDSQVSEIDDPARREQLQQLVSDAQSAIADEDYARAASLRDQIQDDLQQTGSDDGSEGGLPILLILGVIGIAALAAGALAYIFLIRPEDRQQGQGTTGDDSGGETTAVEFSDTSSRIEHIGKQILATADGFISAVEGAIGSIIDSIGGSDDSDEDDLSDEDDVQVDRKKIRFDEV
jgi:hypothetical protein